eukprot:3275920-Prymnesium_polylepis.1
MVGRWSRPRYRPWGGRGGVLTGRATVLSGARARSGGDVPERSRAVAGRGGCSSKTVQIPSFLFGPICGATMLTRGHFVCMQHPNFCGLCVLAKLKFSLVRVSSR